ncbi:MAG TPA: PQQ-dependent sugar dehydrogenase [Methylomirabilota bacterium]|nr:PQQ-dependent sugar dehydrogenase [Methylomirabilota bacterium]
MVPAVAPVIARRRTTAGLLALVLLAALPGAAGAQGGPKLKVPPGFAIDVFANKVGGVRFMAVDPAGTLLVSEPSGGRVLALPDKNGDGKADGIQTVVDGLDQPHGLAFRDGALHVAENGRVQRFRYDPATMKATQPTVVVPGLPAGGGHWTRTVVFGPDGGLYVSVGSSCNVCRESDKRRAVVLRYNADGSGERIFASGLRNAVGLAFQPGSGALWATVNERDWRGDDVPSDMITEVRDGAFYGWPDCLTVGGKAIPDDRFEKGARCDRVTPPTVAIQAHSAPIGLVFYTGTQFPTEYRGSLFAAYRGSWNRTVPTGYKVVRVRFRDGKPAGV